MIGDFDTDGGYRLFFSARSDYLFLIFSRCIPQSAWHIAICTSPRSKVLPMATFSSSTKLLRRYAALGFKIVNVKLTFVATHTHRSRRFVPRNLATKATLDRALSHLLDFIAMPTIRCVCVYAKKRDDA